MRWTSDVFKQIRFHHLFRTLVNPQRAIREIKYRYTFSSKVQFCSFLTGKQETQIMQLLEECSSHQTFLKSLLINRNQFTIGHGRGAMGDEVELLYTLVRIVKPRVVLETGVGAGISSAFILKALEINGTGELFSIDLPDEEGLSGWAVPDELRNNWHLHIGKSSLLIKPLMERISPIDIFIHDSDHSYENMMFEFRTIWPFLKTGGLFLAHDVGRNSALFDFCRDISFSWTKIRTYPVLGGLKKD